MRRIEFRVSDDIGEALQFQAACRDISVNEYAKAATLAYMAKYPAKGPLAQLVSARRADPKNLGSSANTEQVTG